MLHISHTLFTGCDFKGVQYKDEEDWKLDNNPCVTCTCLGGVVTCMEMQCFQTCDNPISMPGQCCSVCPCKNLM